MVRGRDNPMFDHFQHVCVSVRLCTYTKMCCIHIHACMDIHIHTLAHACMHPYSIAHFYQVFRLMTSEPQEDQEPGRGDGQGGEEEKAGDAGRQGQQNGGGSGDGEAGEADTGADGDRAVEEGKETGGKEGEGDAARVRDVYERAIANVPPTQEKRHWQRYIYLWVNYALFEELDARDADKTRAVYSQCLRIIPHASFTFSKIWVMAAHFEVRQKNLKGARKILGTAVGKCPKEKTFKVCTVFALNCVCPSTAFALNCVCPSTVFALLNCLPCTNLYYYQYISPTSSWRWR